MPLILTEQDAEELWESDTSKVESCYQVDAFEVHHTWRGALDQGWWREIQLRELWLDIEQYQANENLCFETECSSLTPVASFFITGTAKNRHHGLTGENIERPGRHYLEWVQSGIESDYFFVDELVLRVRLRLQPHLLSQLGDPSTLPLELVPFVSGKIPASFYRQGITTPEMQMILHQILNCPYQGAIKQLYLEGKTLELSALQFAQFAANDRSPQTVPLKADEIDRLHQAREILKQQFEHPPSILALAHQVGLNDFKLKQGFRACFGTTVFGYLRDYRLEQAQQLLNDGQMTVQQVARAIGYAHAGHFAAAFKRKFGVSPKAYQSRSL